MKRRYTPALFANRVKTIKELMPHCLIAADVIVGFPGETDEEFEEAYNFIRDTEITYTHVFSYSDRPGTLASKNTNKVPSVVIKQRSQKLQQLSNRKKLQFYNDHIRFKSRVLFESDNNNGYMHGFTENYIKVKTPFNSNLTNRIIPVQLIDIDEDGVFSINFLEA